MIKINKQSMFFNSKVIGLTNNSPISLATDSPNSCSTKHKANSKEVPGPRLVVTSPETWIFDFTAQNVGSLSVNAGWQVILHDKLHQV